MPDIHPRADLLQDLVAGLAGPQRRMLRHLLDCAACRALLAEELGGGERGPDAARVLPWRPVGAAGDGSRAVDGVLQRLWPRLCAAEREQAEAPARLTELLERPVAERLAALAEPRFHSLSLCDRLVAASHEEGFRAPREAEALARLALALAGRLDPERCGEGLLADVRARAWGALGNALRIAGDLRGAQAAFGTAGELWRAGTRDRLDRARLLALQASLRRAQRRLGEADGLLRRAIAIYLRANEGHLAGEAILARAVVAKEAGEPERAIALLREADRRVERGRSLRLELCVRHNLADWLAEAGRFLEARAVLVRSRELYEHHRDRPSRLRRLWVEGKIAAGLGRLEEAAGLLGQVRDGFAAEDLGYDAALAVLDLALVAARRGRAAEARDLAAEALPAFRAREVGREVLAALVVGEQAAAAEGAASQALLEQMAGALRRARRTPVLPFDPA
jgi:tetratricopeptide (TPR) repeat protein